MPRKVFQYTLFSIWNLNTWTEMELRAAQKSPAEVCPCTWLQMVRRKHWQKETLKDYLPIAETSAERDFESFIFQTLCRPLPGIGWRQTQPSGTWDSDYYDGGGYDLNSYGDGDGDGDGDGGISWPGLRLQRRRNKFFPEFSCCKGSLLF